MGDGRSCLALVDCSLGPDVCDDRASCVDVGSGLLRCQCPSGYRGDGGSCTRPVAYGAELYEPDNLEDLVVEDFNGDGRLDLAMMLYAENDISVLINQGDSFAPPAYVAGGNVWCCVSHGGTIWKRLDAGDFNGDTHVDLVTTAYSDDQVHVSFGLGDGTFAPPMPVLAIDNPTNVVAGEFTGDAYDDILVDPGELLVADGLGGFLPLGGGGFGSYSSCGGAQR